MEGTADFAVEPVGVYTPASPQVATGNAADSEGHYVVHDQMTGMFNVKPAGFLSAEPDEEVEGQEGLFVTCGPESDISGRLDSKVPIFTAELGLCWMTAGAKTTLFVFSQAVIVYRANIGVPSRRKNSVTGRPTTYMESYAVVGIPAARYDWLIASIQNVHQVDMTEGPNTPAKRYCGYVWLQVNIVANTEPKGYLVTPTGSRMKPTSLKSYLIKARQNLVGNIGLALTLKRQRGLIDKHVVGAALKFMQVVDTITVSEPPLNTPTEFVLDPSARGSDRLMQLLSDGVTDLGTGEQRPAPVLIRPNAVASRPVGPGGTPASTQASEGGTGVTTPTAPSEPGPR